MSSPQDPPVDSTEDQHLPAGSVSDEDSAPEEYVPEDDAVIGRAFRGSLMAFAAFGAVALLIFWWVSRPDGDDGPEQGIETTAPVAVVESAEAPEVRFEDITTDAGITFSHYNGAYGDKLLPETMGGGVAFFDLEGDGDPDLLFVGSSDWPHASERGGPSTSLAMYRNRGDGTFEDVTSQVGLGVSFYGMGVAVGDMDGDGDQDLFFSAVGENLFFENRDGRFVDITAAAGVAGDVAEWSTGATFFDLEGDGDLDLFVGNYVRWSKEIDFQLDYRLTGVGRAYGPPQNYGGSFPYLYRNEGDGTFTDISAESGVQVKNPATEAPMAKVMAVSPVDVEGDGDLDLLVANDTVRNFLYENQGDGTFQEMGELYGIAYDRNGGATGAMGSDVGYFRNDHNLGFLVGNFANEMTSVYVAQDDPGIFVDEAIGEGIGAPSRRMLSFGVFLFDYDLDGRLDLLQANGHLEEEIGTVDPSQEYRQAAQLFWNGGDAGFVPVDADTTGELARPLVGRGSAYADIDADGDLDVVITQVAGPPLLLRNDQATGHHWLRLRLVGQGANPGALGADVWLTSGGTTQHRSVTPTRSYLSQSETVLTFGLGAAETVDKVEIRWPDGSRQEVTGLSVDTVHTVEQGG